MFVPTPEERIYFCRVCKNYKTDDWKRELCSLTDKPPAFEKRCPSFDLNPDAAKKDFQRYTAFETTGEATAVVSKRSSGIFLVIAGSIKLLGFLTLAVVSANHGGSLGIAPFIFIITGIAMIIAGSIKIKEG
jgi:hypothetical protein